MESVTAAIVSACISAVIGALVASIFAFVKGKGHKAVDTNKALMDGMRALLWREIKNIHSEAKESGGMTTEERNHLESVYQAYHAINGNGTGTRLYEDAMSTDVLP